MHTPCDIASPKLPLLYLFECGTVCSMHEKLIADLGGYKWLASQLKLKPNRVRMWQGRGVAYSYRPMIARLASERHIVLPRDFLEPKAA